MRMDQLLRLVKPLAIRTARHMRVIAELEQPKSGKSLSRILGYKSTVSVK